MAQIQCQLWMGSLEPDMTESFIMSAFYKMGECPQSVKVMRNKYTGEPAGYCFVHFNNDEEAVDAMHKLNGKPIPGTMPVVRFRLNNACRESKNNVQNDKEFSIWVGDLTNDVDDYSLYRLFSNRYSSIKTAKVILDNAGYSKGFGFVRFGNEAEQLNALYSMNGYVGLGLKPLKICTAVPRPKNSVNPAAPSTAVPSGTNYGNSQQEYSQYYDPSTYWQNYQAWNGYYNSAAGDQTQVSAVEQTAADPASAQAPPPDDDLALVDHRQPIDVEQLNKEVMEYDRCLWDALESSKWFPNDTLEVA